MTGETEMTFTGRTKLKDIESQDLDEDERKSRDEYSLVSKIAQGTAATAIALWIIATALSGGSNVVVVALLVGSLVSGAVIYFQFKIENTDSESKDGVLGDRAEGLRNQASHLLRFPTPPRVCMQHSER